MTESLEVPATLAGERVDRAVALLTGWSRAEVQVLIEDGQPDGCRNGGLSPRSA